MINKLKELWNCFCNEYRKARRQQVLKRLTEQAQELDMGYSDGPPISRRLRIQREARDSIERGVEDAAQGRLSKKEGFEQYISSEFIVGGMCLLDHNILVEVAEINNENGEIITTEGWIINKDRLWPISHVYQ